jgi:hypothetical protein
MAAGNGHLTKLQFKPFTGWHARRHQGGTSMAKQRRTSAKAAKAASSVLRSKSTGTKSKTAAASALSQRAPKSKSKKK